MRLLVTTPTAIVLDVDDVRHVRAEDRTGAFGIEQGHAEFLTVLAVSVMSYQDAAAVERYVAVHGGVFRVRGGTAIEVATSEALAGDDLQALQQAVIARYGAEVQAEAKARTRATKLHLLAIGSVYRYVRGGTGVADFAMGRANGEEDIE